MNYAPTLTAAELYEEVWRAEFEPLIAEKRRRIEETITEGMLDVALTLCGENVRQMTPHDMLHLDAMGNVFIAGSPDGVVHFIDCAGLIWQLHTANNHTNSIANLYRRDRLIRRLSRLELNPMVTEIMAYVDRMLMQSAPTRSPEAHGETKSVLAQNDPKTHFLAPLIVEVAAEIGHIDPMSGLLLAHTPLPRLKQYQRAAIESKGEGKVYTETDGLRNRCIERTAQIIAERAAAAAAPVSCPPSPVA